MARKEKKYHFIYKTTNLITKRYYFGMHSTDDLNDGYMGSGKRLRYSINKYGSENHTVEILEYFSDRESLINREKEIVCLNEIAKEDCMNLMCGGNGGFISDEQQRYRSICANKVRNLMYETDEEFRINLSKKISEKAKLNHSLGKYSHLKNIFTFKGNKHTDDTKRKMSESSKGIGVGKNNSQFGTCWITKDGNNKKIKFDEYENYENNGWVKGRVV